MVIEFAIMGSISIAPDTVKMNREGLRKLEQAPNDVTLIRLYIQREIYFDVDYPGAEYFWTRIYEYHKRHDIPIEVLVNVDASSTTDLKNITITEWPTHFLTHVHYRLTQCEYDYTNADVYKYPFIFLVRRPTKPRILMRHALEAKGLMDCCVYSWKPSKRNTYDNKENVWESKRLTEHCLYLENYGRLNPALPPVEYADAFAQLVPETSTSINFITEKTAIPLLLKKPFIALAAKGYHLFLQEKYGFEQYTELFDYSFDSLEFSPRVDAITDNFYKIANMSQGEQQQMYKVLLPKLERNAARARKLALDINNLPKSITDHYVEGMDVGQSAPHRNLNLVEFCYKKDNT